MTTGPEVFLNNRPVAPTVPAPISDPAGSIRILVNLLERLGITDALQRSRRLLDRAEQLEQITRDVQQRAREQRQKAIDALVADADADVDTDALAAMLAEVRPWLGDTDVFGAGAVPPQGVNVLMQAARLARSHAVAMLPAETPGLYQRLQGVARETVAATAKLRPLPQHVWGSPEPSTAAIREGHGQTWTKLVEEWDRFLNVHRAGEILRRSGGLGASVQLPGGIPDSIGFMFRNWMPALDGQRELGRLKPPLRLRYAIDNGWEPGLWLAADLSAAPPKRKPLLTSWVG